MRELELIIKGITCSSCIKPIKNLFKKDKVEIEISPTTGYSIVNYDEANISSREIIDRIKAMGYDVEEEN